MLGLSKLMLPQSNYNDKICMLLSIYHTCNYHHRDFILSWFLWRLHLNKNCRDINVHHYPYSFCGILCYNYSRVENLFQCIDAYIYLLPAEIHMPPLGYILTHSTGEPWSNVKTDFSDRLSHKRTVWSYEPKTYDKTLTYQLHYQHYHNWQHHHSLHFQQHCQINII